MLDLELLRYKKVCVMEMTERHLTVHTNIKWHAKKCQIVLDSVMEIDLQTIVFTFLHHRGAIQVQEIGKIRGELHTGTHERKVVHRAWLL